MSMGSIRTLDLIGQRVLLRADLDVPIKNGKVNDDSRLRAGLLTINYLVEHLAKIIIIGHLGRPGGKSVPELSLAPVAQRLAEIGPYPHLVMTGGFLDPAAKAVINQSQPGGLVVLENIRFYPDEERNDREFSHQLASLGQVYVNDCFSTSHRASASFVGVPQFLPSFPGFDLEKEVINLGKLLEQQKRPVVVILGGIKKDKLERLEDFVKKADFVLLGSTLADNLTDAEKETISGKVIVGRGDKDLDEVSRQKFTSLIKTAKTVIWAGPLGRYEEGFIEGSRAVAEAIIATQAVSIVGGGDTLAVLDHLNLRSKMTYSSEAGGAMLEFMCGRRLPGLEALGYYD